jgi:predicted dehydrogenase
MSRQVTVAVVGAGHRSRLYSRWALDHPDKMKVVAVAEPDAVRRAALADEHRVPAGMRFASWEGLLAGGKVADAVINGTMDRLHYASSMALIGAGYHVLLEKPIAMTEPEVRGLIAAAGAHGRTVMICHVLRYAPFYATIKELIVGGRIGEIVSIHTGENVSYHHMATAFVRGRWRREDQSSPMMLAKCCHDLDILAWLMSGVPVRTVASAGALSQFRVENAPPGSTDRCLNGCAVEATCPYSARMYVANGMWPAYAWESIEHIGNPTEDDKVESLKTNNPYGRCVWRCDNDVVDHQSVLVQFENGVTATHDMFCATARPSRTIHVVGSRGEIEGDMEAGRIVVRRPEWAARDGYAEEKIVLGVTGDGHGGGDFRLVEDFIATLRGEATSRGATRIEDSLTGHLIAFAADVAMRGRSVVSVNGC